MPEPDTQNSPFLSPVQRRIVAAGSTALAAVLVIATGVLLLIILRGFVTTFQHVLLPLAIAAILATLLRPLVTCCETYTRLSRLQGIILLYLLVVLVLALTAVYVVPALLHQAGEFLKMAPELGNNLVAFFKSSAPAIYEWLHDKLGQSPDAYVRELVNGDSGFVQSTLAKLQSSAGSMALLVGRIFALIAAYAIIPIYLFFILNGDRDIWKDAKTQLNFLPAERRDDLIFLGRQFTQILVAFFRGQIIIGLLLGVVLAVGFGLVGLRFGIVIGMVLGLLNIIPYLGTILGIMTVLPLAYLQEGGGLLLIGLCAIVFTIGQLLTDYVFTPRIMGDKTGMGPMLIIFSVFFWGTALGGILGMVLAIPLTACFLIFWRLAREKYLPALTAPKEIAPE